MSRRGTLARLQQALTTAAAVGAAAWALVLWRAGHPAWAVAGAVAIVFGYAAVLALEFVLLAATHRDDPAPRASPAALWRAWLGEVRAGAVTFGWRQPWRSARWPDHLPADARGRRGLLLVHGFVCNRGFWNAWMARLHARGTPFVAVTLEPVFGPIDRHVDAIEAAVRRLEAATGLPPVAVAHSMGGLALRLWWCGSDDARLHHAVTIATPHRGTWLARFARRDPGLQMRPECDWLCALLARERAARAERITCFFGHCDNVVFPPRMATLPGADNRHLAGVAHVAMAARREPWDEVLRRLDEPPAQVASNRRSPGSTTPASISPERSIVSRTRA